MMELRSADEFLTLGRETAETILQTLTATGVSLREPGRVLDYGADCGRMERWWPEFAPRVQHFAMDINPRLIDCCKAHLGFGSYSVNALLRPIGYDDGRAATIFSGRRG